MEERVIGRSLGRPPFHTLASIIHGVRHGGLGIGCDVSITVLAAGQARCALRPCLRLRVVIFGRGRLRRDSGLSSLQRDVARLGSRSHSRLGSPRTLCDLRRNTIGRIEQKTIFQVSIALGRRHMAMTQKLAGHDQRLTLHHRL